MGVNSYNDWETLNEQLKKQYSSTTNFTKGFTDTLSQFTPAATTLSTLNRGYTPDATTSTASTTASAGTFKPTFQMQVPTGTNGNTTINFNQAGKTMADYYGENSGIFDWNNGQVATGLNIANTALNAAQIGLGAYYNHKNYKLQKQALNLQKQDLAYNQQTQYNKALSSANILAGMARGVEGFDADANTAAVKAAYTPTIKA